MLFSLYCHVFCIIFKNILINENISRNYVFHTFPISLVKHFKKAIELKFLHL